MSEIAYRPRSASEIVDAAFQLFRQHFKTFVVVTAVAYLPMLVINNVLAYRFNFEESIATGELSAVMLISPLLGLVWFGLVGALLALAASEAYLQRVPNPAAVFRAAVSRAATIIACVLVVTAAIGVGMILLVVPSIYLYAKYGMAPIVAMLEGTGVRESLTRSAVLSQGRKWHILKTMMLVLVIFFGMVFALGFVALALANPLFIAAVGFLVTILTYPLIALVQTILYYDMRIRAEGYDVQLMSERLGLALDPAPAYTG